MQFLQVYPMNFKGFNHFNHPSAAISPLIRDGQVSGPRRDGSGSDSKSADASPCRPPDVPYLDSLQGSPRQKQLASEELKHWFPGCRYELKLEKKQNKTLQIWDQSQKLRESGGNYRDLEKQKDLGIWHNLDYKHVFAWFSMIRCGDLSWLRHQK